MGDTFSKLHPIVNFLFFAFVISLSMFILNPVCLVISFICAFANALYLNGKKAIRLSLMYMLPTVLIIIIGNPVFNHEGVTIIDYFPWGNPLTLESILYGVATAALLFTAVLWFSCFNSVMTSDKFIYLFGRIIPSLSLVLSMALRFVPKFTVQFTKVRNTQRCIGRDISDGSIFTRIKHCIKIISIMITWSLENAIETADSMKSRGHGLKGRTAYIIYKFTKRDAVVLAAIIICGGTVSILALCGVSNFEYFPYIDGELASISAIIEYVLYGILSIIPLILNVEEEVKWKRLRSAI